MRVVWYFIQLNVCIWRIIRGFCAVCGGKVRLTFWLYATLPAANRAAGNVGEVLRGNERPQGATDLAKPNPGAARTGGGAYTVCYVPLVLL